MASKRKQQELPSRSSKRQLSQRRGAINTVDQLTPVIGSASDRAMFGAVWRILRGAGWTSKPPRRSSLSDLFRYVPPEGNPNGEEGIDFFLGEQALLDYYRSTCESSGTLTTTDNTVTTSCGATNEDAVPPANTAVALNASPVLSDYKANTVDDFHDKGSSEYGDCNDSGCIDCTTFDGVTEVGGKFQDDLSFVESCGSKGMTYSDSATNSSTAISNTCTQSNLFVAETTLSAMDQPMCAVCNSECSTQRVCTWCKKCIHHFCSHDVCRSLKLPDGEGGFLEDFGDNSYCSKMCYTSAAKVNLAPQNTATRSHTHLTIASRDCATANGPTAALTSGKSKSKRATPTRLQQPSANTAKKAAPPKPKAPRKKSKAEIQASVMKNELLRRARDAAEKFINACVAFAPADEEWMPRKLYKAVGSSILMGVVTRCNIQTVTIAKDVKVPSTKFEIQWTTTDFQAKEHTHHVSEAVVVRGIRQYTKLNQRDLQFGESWTSLCSIVPKMSNIPALTEEFEELDEHNYRTAFREDKELQIPLSPREVEEITSMKFSPTASLGQPPGLYAHSDGTSITKLRQQSRNLFGRSATEAFFAFIPLSFWSQVVVFTNTRADSSGNPSPKAVTLDELMKFLGILWYMTLVDKGEMRNYWVNEEEDNILPGSRTVSLDSIMTWRRFIYIRTNLSFRSAVSITDVQRDPAARIRPLINILKSRCLRHVEVGRNVAVDEASIACRSRYARHIIVFNSQKPTGKYHFKLYVCCCSTSWYVISFKLHCSSTLFDRLGGVVSGPEMAQIEDLIGDSTGVRSHVLEVTSSLRGSNRIVNTDNFYTSCLLMESLRSVGLYGRGTVRASSKHFPHFTMIKKEDEKPRGYMKQGVCVAKHIVAASWVDGSIVNVVSNADASGSTTVYRRVQDKRIPFTAPTCVSEYNSAMQGVDRHDQLRGRFSLADGHSFQKWHKKLAMAMIDIARCNAYICDGLARGLHGVNSDDHCSTDWEDNTGPRTRDRHRVFMNSLVRELFNGEWKKCLENDCGLVYSTATTANKTAVHSQRPETHVSATPQGLPQVCVAKEAWIALKGRSRSMRKCTVCKFECRSATQKTDYCETHRVALCKRSYPVDSTKPYLCQQESWTCWQKYHLFYLPKQVYTVDGNLRRTSPIYEAQQQYLKAQREQHKAKPKD